MNIDQSSPSTAGNETKPGGGRRALWLGLAIFVLALLPRLGTIWETQEAPSVTVPIGESAVYDRAARELRGDDGATALLFWRSPAYVAFLAAAQSATGDSVTAVRTLQAILGALTCWLVFVLARRRLGDGLAAVAGLLTAWWGPLIFFDSLLLPVALAALLSLLLIALLERAATGGRLLWGIVFGVAVGLAVLTQIAFLLFAILALVWLAWTKKPDGWRLTASALAGCVLVLLPAVWAARTATGSFDPLPRSGGFDFFLGNHPEACTLLEKPPRLRFEELDALPGRSPGDPAPNFTARALSELRQEPSRFLGGLIGKLGRLLSSREQGDVFDVYAARSSSKLLATMSLKVGPIGFPWVELLPCVLLALFRRRVDAPLGLFLLAYSLALILTRVDAAARAVLVPALAWTAALGIAAAIDAWRASRTARLVAAAVLVAGVLVAVLPGPFCEEAIATAKLRDYELGAAYDERDDVAAAVKSYQRVLEQDVRFAPAHRQLGRLFLGGGELDGAVAHYRSLLQLEPDAETHTVLAEALQRQGKSEEALVHRQALVELEPDNIEARLALGEALIAQGLYDRAKGVLQEAARRAPTEARAHFALGGLYLRQGAIEPAIAALEESLRLEPTATAHNELGTALLGLQRLEEAGEHFHAAIAADPNYVDAYSNAGAVSAMLGQLDAAGELFAQAIQRDPDYLDARYNLAWVLLQQGEKEAAIAQLREILRRRPDHAKARQQLQVLLGQGNEGGP